MAGAGAVGELERAGRTGLRRRSRAEQSVGRPAHLRKIALRLPPALWPIPETYGHVMAFTEDGKVVVDLQDPSGVYPETTGVTETSDRIYVQSLHAKGLGWMRQIAP